MGMISQLNRSDPPGAEGSMADRRFRIALDPDHLPILHVDQNSTSAVTDPTVTSNNFLIHFRCHPLKIIQVLGINGITNLVGQANRLFHGFRPAEPGNFDPGQGEKALWLPAPRSSHGFGSRVGSPPSPYLACLSLFQSLGHVNRLFDGMGNRHSVELKSLDKHLVAIHMGHVGDHRFSLLPVY